MENFDVHKGRRNQAPPLAGEDEWPPTGSEPYWISRVVALKCDREYKGHYYIHRDQKCRRGRGSEISTRYVWRGCRVGKFTRRVPPTLFFLHHNTCIWIRRSCPQTGKILTPDSSAASLSPTHSPSAPPRVSPRRSRSC